MLDREQWSENDIPMTTIVAARIGIELEESLLRGELEEAAAGRERVRLARDMHDGVLQGLAAASIQLKISADQMPSRVKATMQGVRDILADETRRIREFVEETRSSNRPVKGVVPLAREIKKRIDSLKDQWSCTISLKLYPPNMETSVSRVREIRHLISEAVSNAARHGRASEVQIDIDYRGDQLVMRILDNGSGFDNLSQSGATMPGPFSLRSRVDELGGTLFLSSSHLGTDITIHLPP
jgi:signal transduction histidine kinase